MRLLKKARRILRTHGIPGAIGRAGRRVQRGIEAQAATVAHRAAWGKLLSRVQNSRPVYFPRHENPLASVIIPVYNNVRFTAACLNALLRELGSIPIEVIIVDDGSADSTRDYLGSCSGIQVITHVENRGVLQSLNEGAAAARARYLHFLNNGTIVTHGWMVALLRAFESCDGVGAVGSQLRTPDGRISEAGALVWKDGSASNYGRERRASDPGIAFPREVDYCSAASLMVRAAVFRELGGFSPEFAPAYYEDVDFCFRLRAAGYRVLYEPGSVVVHFEGSTAGTNTSKGIKRYQVLHRDIFAVKWSGELATHFPPDENLIERAARRLAGKRTVLVIDSFIPFDDRSAGGRRLLAVMRLMRELDWHVVFVANDGGAYEPYTSRARAAGIEVIPHRGDALRTIRDLAIDIDIAWISRPDLLQKYMPHLHRRTKSKIIYDTVDLHFLRLQREAEMGGRDNGWQTMRELECDLARKSDAVVVTSEAERALLAQAGIAAHVVPIIENSVQTQTPYCGRKDLLFLGNYTHEPNVDAAMWLINEIMPRLWERIPNLCLTLAGAEPTPAVRRLTSDRVRVTGHVPDIRPLFESARLLVAPLRFGAGMKGKIVQSLAHGLPVVTTSIGAEGIGLTGGLDAIIADDTAAMADAILHAYTDEALWRELAGAGRAAAEHFTPSAVRPKLEQALEAALSFREAQDDEAVPI